MPKFLLEALVHGGGHQGNPERGQKQQALPPGQGLDQISAPQRRRGDAVAISHHALRRTVGDPVQEVELGLGQRLAVRHGQALPRAARRRNLEPRPLISPDYGYLFEATGGLPVDSSGSPNIHDGVKAISAREDRLLRLVLRFFEQRVFGPLRLERLEKQLRAQARSERRNGKLAGTRLRKQIAEVDRKIKAQVQALEKGVEPELVSERIAELRGDKEALEEALAEVGAEREEMEDDELAKQLARVPDLSKALAEATPEVQRQVFQAFDLQIAYDKVGRRIEISATVSEAVANAFEDTKALQKEGSAVVVRDIAGARFVSRYHPRIIERGRLAD